MSANTDDSGTVIYLVYILSPVLLSSVFV